MSETLDEKNLRRLVDKEEIKRLIYDYTYHLDMNHPQEMAALFVDDCEISYAPGFGAKGKKEYLKTLEGIGTFFVATSHHVSNVCIDFTGEDTAKSRSVVYAFHRYTRDQPDSHLWGQYIDDFQRVDGVWRFKRRELREAASTNFHVKKSNPLGRTE